MKTGSLGIVPHYDESVGQGLVWTKWKVSAVLVTIAFLIFLLLLPWIYSPLCRLRFGTKAKKMQSSSATWSKNHAPGPLIVFLIITIGVGG